MSEKAITQEELAELVRRDPARTAVYLYDRAMLAERSLVSALDVVARHLAMAEALRAVIAEHRRLLQELDDKLRGNNVQ